MSTSTAIQQEDMKINRRLRFQLSKPKNGSHRHPSSLSTQQSPQQPIHSRKVWKVYSKMTSHKIDPRRRLIPTLDQVLNQSVEKNGTTKEYEDTGSIQHGKVYQLLFLFLLLVSQVGRVMFAPHIHATAPPNFFFALPRLNQCGPWTGRWSRNPCIRLTVTSTVSKARYPAWSSCRLTITVVGS